MADFYLHCRIAQVVADKQNHPIDNQMLYIGAQGPDPYLYVLRKNVKPLAKKLGSITHDKDTAAFLTNLVKNVKVNLDEKTYAFLLGYICHYAMDVKLHPYVYYHVGLYDENKPETFEYRGLHVKFERSIDYDMIELEQHMKPEKFPFNDMYFPRYELPDAVCELVGKTVNETYNLPDGDKLYKLGVKTMQWVFRHLVYDRFGIKKLLFKLVDLFNKKQDLFYQDLSMYHHTANFDFLNNEKRTWYHPVTNEKFNYSVQELFNQAVLFASSLIKPINTYLYENKEIDFDGLFTNLSFNSGVECTSGNDMRYFLNYKKLIKRK